MANSEDRSVPENPEFPTPPTLESPPAPASVGEATPTTDTGIATNPTASVGALGIPSTASTEIVFNFGTHAVDNLSGIPPNPVLRVYGSSVPIHSVNDADADADASPKKRGTMLNAGEGTSEDRTGKPNVEPVPAPEPTTEPAPTPVPPQISVRMITCYICKDEFDSLIALFAHMHSHPEISYGPYAPLVSNREEVSGDRAPPPPVPPPSPERSNRLPDLNGHVELEPTAAAAPAEGVYRLPDLNFPPPEEEEDEEEE